MSHYNEVWSSLLMPYTVQKEPLPGHHTKACLLQNQVLLELERSYIPCGTCPLPCPTLPCPRRPELFKGEQGPQGQCVSILDCFLKFSLMGNRKLNFQEVLSMSSNSTKITQQTSRYNDLCRVQISQ